MKTEFERLQFEVMHEMHMRPPARAGFKPRFLTFCVRIACIEIGLERRQGK